MKPSVQFSDWLFGFLKLLIWIIISKLDYDISSWNLDWIFELDLGTFVFKFQVCCVRKFVTSLDSRGVE